MDLPDGAYDLRTLEILGLRHTVGLSNDEILDWFAGRAAVRAGHYTDHTIEEFRLEFARHQYQSGAMTDGQVTEHAPRIEQVVAMVTSEEADQRPPEYSGGCQ